MILKEILEEIKEIQSSKKELREFGLTLGIIFAVLGGWGFWRHKPHVEYFLALSAALLVLAFAAPAFLKPFQKIWMSLALLMGWVMSRVILSVLFYGILTPLSLALHLSGKELLQKKWREKKDTFWVNRAINDADRKYENQY